MPTTPAPTLFNALKHHLGYVRQLIHTTPSSIPLPELRQLLLPIGSAQLDFYTGPLSPRAISQEVLQQLEALQALELPAYQAWLRPRGYQLFELSDASHWVVRLGKAEGRWVHLHPARHSLYTCRLKANSLKTALAMRITQTVQEDLSALNSLRASLHLPPLAPGQDSAHLQQTLSLLG